MKKLGRRDFLKLVGAGVGAAAVAQAPLVRWTGAGGPSGGEQLSFTLVGPLPEHGFPEFASLVVQGHATKGSPASGFVAQRVVPGHPYNARARPFPRMSHSGRLDEVRTGGDIVLRGTIEDAADWRYARDRAYELVIDPAAGTAVYRVQGRSHRLRVVALHGV